MIHRTSHSDSGRSETVDTRIAHLHRCLKADKMLERSLTESGKLCFPSRYQSSLASWLLRWPGRKGGPSLYDGDPERLPVASTDNLPSLPCIVQPYTRTNPLISPPVCSGPVLTATLTAHPPRRAAVSAKPFQDAQRNTFFNVGF